MQIFTLRALAVLLPAMGLMAAPDLSFAQELPGQGFDCSIAKFNYRNGAILVHPSGGDDAGNIFCALQAAQDSGITEVQLSAGEFAISPLVAENFSGALKGSGVSATRLAPLPASTSCEEWQSQGMKPAVLTFSGGSPTLGQMTIEAGDPCQEATFNEERSLTLVKFTGKPEPGLEGYDPATDGVDVIDARLDRVRLLQADTDIKMAAVSVEPQKARPSCSNTRMCARQLRGFTRINKVEISGFRQSVVLDLIGSAEILQSSFEGGVWGVTTAQPGHNLLIRANQFQSTAETEGSYTAILISSIGHQPYKAGIDSTITISSNRFAMVGSEHSGGTAIHVLGLKGSGRADSSLNVHTNEFHLSGPHTIGVSVFEGWNGRIAGNIFKQTPDNANFGILFEAFPLLYPSSHSKVKRRWQIVGNSFCGDSALGIYFEVPDHNAVYARENIVAFNRISRDRVQIGENNLWIPPEENWEANLAADCAK